MQAASGAAPDGHRASLPAAPPSLNSPEVGSLGYCSELRVELGKPGHSGMGGGDDVAEGGRSGGGEMVDYDGKEKGEMIRWGK